MRCVLWVAILCLFAQAACCPAPAAQLKLRLQARTHKFIFVKRACEPAGNFMQRLVRRLELPDESTIRLSLPFRELNSQQSIVVERVGVKACGPGPLRQQCVDRSLKQNGVALLDNAMDVELVEVRSQSTGTLSDCSNADMPCFLCTAIRTAVG